MKQGDRVFIYYNNLEHELSNKTGIIIALNLYSYPSQDVIILLEEPMKNGNIGAIIPTSCLTVI